MGYEIHLNDINYAALTCILYEKIIQKEQSIAYDWQSWWCLDTIVLWICALCRPLTTMCSIRLESIQFHRGAGCIPETPSSNSGL